MSYERDLVRHVVEHGWLDGKLKRPPREPKPKPDIKLVRARRVEARLASWRTKLKRAQTAIKKLERARRGYAKRGLL